MNSVTEELQQLKYNSLFTIAYLDHQTIHMYSVFGVGFQCLRRSLPCSRFPLFFRISPRRCNECSPLPRRDRLDGRNLRGKGWQRLVLIAETLRDLTALQSSILNFLMKSSRKSNLPLCG